MRHPLSSVHETFCKIVRYQNRETCIGAFRLILGADRLILDLKTRETYGFTFTGNKLA